MDEEYFYRDLESEMWICDSGELYAGLECETVLINTPTTPCIVCTSGDSSTISEVDEDLSGELTPSRCPKCTRWDCIDVSSTAMLTPPLTPIKTNTYDNITHADYVSDIIEYFKKLERRYFLQYSGNHQYSISYKVRAIVVDWLIQVQSHLGLEEESLLLCVHLMDRFFMLNEVTLVEIQLVAVACLLIASKYAEELPVEINKLIFLTESSYRPADITKMELRLLAFLEFNINFPTPFTFSYIFCNEKTTTRHLVSYIIELSMCDSVYQFFLPSVIVASSLYCAKILLSGDGRKTLLTNQLDISCAITGYGSQTLWPCVSRLFELVSNAASSPIQGARQKYSNSSRYFAVSKLQCVENPRIEFVAEF